MSFGPMPIFPFVKKYKRPDDRFIVIAGSCSVESALQIHDMAELVKLAGGTHLRGGLFRAGTYPKAGAWFGWVDESLMNSYKAAADAHGLKNIIEVLDYTDESLEMIAKYCDVFQVGARSQQNYSLLRKLGQYGKPVFLKRNTGCTVNEWLGSAEHLLLGGVKELHLIERGSSTFHDDCRWTPTVHVIPSVRELCDIPVIMDASHSTGRRDIVPSVTLAGVAAGAGGVLIECHREPDKSISDAEQALDVKDLPELIKKIHKVREAIK